MYVLFIYLNSDLVNGSIEWKLTGDNHMDMISFLTVQQSGYHNGTFLQHVHVIYNVFAFME